MWLRAGEKSGAGWNEEKHLPHEFASLTHGQNVQQGRLACKYMQVLLIHANQQDLNFTRER